MNIGSLFLLLLLVAAELMVALGDEVAAKKQHEYSLRQKLLDCYEKSFLPRLNESQPVTMQFFFELINIRDVDAKNQFISLYGWVRQKWFNPMFQWNASEFGGIERITMDAERVWVPDILLYNNWDSFDRIGGGPDTFKTPVVLSPDGINSWNSPAIFHSLCDMDVTYFPFDVQKCKLKFGSWTLSTAELIMEVENYTTNPSENYLKNGEWELIRADFSKKIVQYAVGAYQDLTLTIEISRNYYTYFINLVIPCALISAMIFLSFLLPPECGERISLGITVLLAMTVFQQLTQQLFPSFDIPLLGQYYIATSVEIGLALVATTMVLNFKFRRATKMSGWLRRLLLVHLAWLVGLKETIDKTCPEMKGKAPRHDKRGQVHLEKKRKAAQQLQDVLNGCRRRTDAASYDVSIETDETVEQNGHCGRFDARTFTPREGNVDCANSAEAPGTLGGNELEPSDDELAVRQWEWNMAANVLDRFLLALSVIVGVGTFFSIFLQAPRVRSFFT